MRYQVKPNHPGIQSGNVDIIDTGANMPKDQREAKRIQALRMIAFLDLWPPGFLDMLRTGAFMVGPPPVLASFSRDTGPRSSTPQN
jgi:hypothetical protein